MTLINGVKSSTGLSCGRIRVVSCFGPPVSKRPIFGWVVSALVSGSFRPNFRRESRFWVVSAKV